MRGVFRLFAICRYYVVVRKCEEIWKICYKWE